MAVRTKLWPRQIRLHVGIATVFVVIVAVMTGGIVWNVNRQASLVAQRTADQLFDEVANKVDERINGMLGAVQATVDAASAMPGLAGQPRYDGLSHTALETMIRMFEAQPNVFAVSVGFGSGAFIQVTATRGDPDVSAAFDVPPGTDLSFAPFPGTATASGINTSVIWMAIATWSARAPRSTRPMIRAAATGT